MIDPVFFAISAWAFWLRIPSYTIERAPGPTVAFTSHNVASVTHTVHAQGNEEKERAGKLGCSIVTNSRQQRPPARTTHIGKQNVPHSIRIIGPATRKPHIQHTSVSEKYITTWHTGAIGSFCRAIHSTDVGGYSRRFWWRDVCPSSDAAEAHNTPIRASHQPPQLRGPLRDCTRALILVGDRSSDSGGGRSSSGGVSGLGGLEVVGGLVGVGVAGSEG